MHYLRSIGFVFEQQRWPTTLALLALASLVPMIGPVVANGYQAALVVDLQRRGDDHNSAGFDLERLTDYLLRGLRIFVVGLVASVALLPLIALILIGGGVTMAFASANEQTALVLFTTLAMAVASALVAVALAVGIAPLWLRAAFLDDLGAAFDLAFCRDFWRRTWGPCVASSVFMFGAAIVLVLAGMLLCMVGIFPAIALVFVMQSHLYWQLYREYLERGGTPLE